MQLTPPAGSLSVTGPLALGSRGPDVRTLQVVLNRGVPSPRLQPDGAFGLNTDAAVRAFQRSHNLKPDGIVGPLTAAALGLRFSARAFVPPLPQPGPPRPLDTPAIPGQVDQSAISQLVEAVVQGLSEIQNGVIRAVLAVADLPDAIAAEIRSRLSGPFQMAIQTVRDSVRAAASNIAGAGPMIAAAIRSAVQRVITALQDIIAVLARLPDLLGLTGIIDRIRGIVSKIQRAVESVIDLVLRTLRGAGKSLGDAARAIIAILRSATA